jgi:exopolysaccharide production protein ExoZ
VPASVEPGTALFAGIFGCCIFGVLLHSYEKHGTPMMQNKTQELFGVQALRGLAALAVVFHHSLEESNGAPTAFSPDWLTTFGASGVDIFFVISGFIMLYTGFPNAGRPLSPGSFFFRRVTRIYPFYWICCLVMLGIMVAGFLSHHHLEPSETALSLALLPSSRQIIGVSWTLVYEIYFYVLFAISLLFRSDLASAILTTAFIAIMRLTGELLNAGTLQTFLTNPIPFEFALGLWLAFAFMRTEAVGRCWHLPPAYAALGVTLLAIAPLYVYHTSTNGLSGLPRVLAWGVPAVVITAASLSRLKPRGFFQRGMVLLGDASYALYLTHVFVMTGYAFTLKVEFIYRLPQIFVVPLVVLLAVAVGIAAHLIVEKPLNRFVRLTTGRGLA